ncbi:hypothetical protein [uncultured Methanobrevibacter sp.]|nr:hypothetical protein [uncultured Methanobrevibacter sp.]
MSCRGMIKTVKENFDLMSGVSSRICCCPILNCLGQNRSIFKTMMEHGKF